MRVALFLVATLTLMGLSSAIGCAEDKEVVAIHQDKQELMADTSWIYDDFDQALATADAQGKPVMVLVRCVP